jgi:predicted tellurium resistance membrane protein TerC
MIASLITLALLVLLQAVLGFDNLLYISLESKRVPARRQAYVRRLGIGIGVFLRIGLLFVVIHLVETFSDPLFGIHFGAEITPENIHGAARGKNVLNAIDGEFNLHSLILLFGGVFIVYTAVKEIFHMLGRDNFEHGEDKPRSVKMTIFWIVLMNLVFSFDSILSAMALATDPETGEPVFWIMALAILIGGALMIWLADRVAEFLDRNRLYEVLGLFILLVVGIMLLTEGAHTAHLHLAGNEVTPMTKTTFYFVITVLILTDIVQSRYQKKLMAKRKQLAAPGTGDPA